MAEPEKLKQSDLADRLLVTKGNISGMLSRMTELGTVRRADDPHDKRSKRIEITARGRKLQEAGRGIQEDLVEEMFEGFDGERLDLLESIVGELSERINLAKSC